MTRLFLAIALVLQLSGVSAAAAVVCADRGMPMPSCCCRHTSSSPSESPLATPSCPCKMSPDVPAPVGTAPVTPASSSNPIPATLAAALPIGGAFDAATHCAHVSTIVDSSPPYLTAAHPRC